MQTASAPRVISVSDRFRSIRRVKRLVQVLWLVLLMSVGLTGGAAANDNDRNALADELLQLINIRETTENLLEQIRQVQIEELEGLEFDAQQIEMAKELQRRTFDILYAELTWESLKPDYVRLYASTFSEEELTVMVLFYGSPAGRNLVAKMPGLVHKTTELVDTRVQEVLPQIQQMMLELIVGKPVMR
ncbi:MAG: DUF2059 domain-containing protein [Desulfuromonadales bacterium]